MALVLLVAFGFLIALLARTFVPASQRLSFLLVLWLGVAGALLGGLVMSFATLQRVTEVHAAGVIGSIIGAFLGLAAGGGFRRTNSPAAAVVRATASTTTQS